MEIVGGSFRQLKACLTSSPILKLPCLAETFFVRTDASMTGLGAALLQKVGGIKMPVAYASKKLLGREQRYSTIERECLGIVFAVRKFHKYIYGTSFVLETDHKPLTYLQSMKNSNDRILRWALLLQNYHFRLDYIKGSDNIVADYLSRQYM